MDRDFDDIGYVFRVRVPIKQSIEVRQAYFVVLTLIKSVSATYSVLDRKELLAKLSSIDPNVPTSLPRFILIKLRQDVDFDRATKFVFS